MKSHFGLLIEFDHSLLLETVTNCIAASNIGYVCVIDANVLTMAQKQPKYRDVINQAMVNTCDGSSIAWMAGLVHKQKFRAFNGPDIFKHFIEKDYRQLLLGSTVETINRIKSKLNQENKNSDHLQSMPLPFLPVDGFDYEKIAKDINKLNVDIIWVSLGAPKQEIFMHSIQPFLNKGVMFGIGAAFNFYTGDIPMSSFQLGGLRFIWINRLFAEPRKLLKRLVPYALLMPKLFFKELINKKNQNS